MPSPSNRLALLRDAQPNTWIAISEDEARIVGSGATYSDAVSGAEMAGEVAPIVLKTPDQWAPLVLGEKVKEFCAKQRTMEGGAPLRRKRSGFCCYS